MVAVHGALRAARRLADSFTPGPPSAKVSAISDRSPHHIHLHHQRQHGLFKGAMFAEHRLVAGVVVTLIGLIGNLWLSGL